MELTVITMSVFLIARLFMSGLWFSKALDIIKKHLDKAATSEQLREVETALEYVRPHINPLWHMLDLTVWTFRQAYPRLAGRRK